MGQLTIYAIRWGVPLIPVVAVWLLLLFVHSLLGWTHQQVMVIELVLPCMFFWRIYRPEAFMVGAVFLSGLLMDMLSMSPFGLHALLYLAAMLFVDAQRHFLSQRQFHEQWMILIACCACVVAGRALAVWGLSDMALLQAWEWIMVPMLGWLAFPVMYQCSHQLYRWMLLMEERLHAV